MDIKVTVSYEIPNFIDKESLKEGYNNNLELALKETIEIESLFGIIDDETEQIIKIEILNKK